MLGQVEEFRARDARSGLKIAQILEGFISRKVVKQTVMTVVYGVTRYGGRLQIEKRLKEIDEFPKVRQSWGSMNVPGGAPFFIFSPRHVSAERRIGLFKQDLLCRGAVLPHSQRSRSSPLSAVLPAYYYSIVSAVSCVKAETFITLMTP